MGLNSQANNRPSTPRNELVHVWQGVLVHVWQGVLVYVGVLISILLSMRMPGYDKH
jgi:hypothetical protein